MELCLSCPNPLIYDGFSYTCSQLCIFKDKDLIINTHNEYVPTIKSKWQKKHDVDKIFIFSEMCITLQTSIDEM